MNEHIFERLPLEEAKGWPLRFIEAVPVGVDLELVFPRFMHWLLSDPDGMRTSPSKSSGERHDRSGPIRHSSKQVLPAPQSLIEIITY